MPDYLRLFALFGIVVVNVQGMAFPVLDGFDAASRMQPIDEIAVWLVNGLAFTKTYGLFSFMFGVGLAFQMRSAQRRGIRFGPLYRNRMLGLAVLGLLHGCLFFAYDILLLYAVTGSILYFLRDFPVPKLVRLAVVLLVIQTTLSAVLMLGPNPPSPLAQIEGTVMTQGSLGDVLVMRSLTFLSLFPFLLLFQGIAALGWFCLGLAAVKAGMIDHSDHLVWQKARRYCLWPGVILSLAGAALWQWGPEALGTALTLGSAPIATLGYLGVIAAIARPPGPRLSRALQAGGSSLSVYLGQSILLSTIFAPYGLGLWDRLGPATTIVIAVLVTCALIWGLTLWRTRFALGPFEWVLRQITQLGTRD